MTEEKGGLLQRAHEVFRQLKEQRALLDATLKRIEEKFVRSLGADARGRVRLREREGRQIEHLVFRGGRLLYESGVPGRPLQSQILHDVEEWKIKILACYKIVDLWQACGGGPMNLTPTLVQQLEKKLHADP